MAFAAVLRVVEPADLARDDADLAAEVDFARDVVDLARDEVDFARDDVDFVRELPDLAREELPAEPVVLRALDLLVDPPEALLERDGDEPEPLELELPRLACGINLSLPRGL